MTGSDRSGTEATSPVMRPEDRAGDFAMRLVPQSPWARIGFGVADFSPCMWRFCCCQNWR